VKVVLSDWDVYRALAGQERAPLDPEHRVATPSDGIAF
jgi:hypothetical protein